MPTINILQYPNPRLKIKGERVEKVDDEIKKIVKAMFETHYSAKNCAALAATQLDFKHPKAITVIDFSENKDQPLCLINPEIIEKEGETCEPEGCMSVPGGIYEPVKRAAKIKVRALNEKGEQFEMEADGFMAKCIQHEVDHLNGILCIDHLSKLKRMRAESRIKKHWRLAKK